MRHSFLFVFSTCVLAANALPQIPFLPKKKKYTPLLFFKGPHGSSPENDALEKCVSEVEKDLGVTVERMDVARDTLAYTTFGMLTSNPPPLLYHRESRQMISLYSGDSDGPPGGTSKAEEEGEEDKKSAPVQVDKDRVRAWAKGRYLPPPQEEKLGAINIISREDDEAVLEQQELLDDQQLTPLQREGKRAILEKTDKDRQAREKAAKRGVR